MFTSLLNAKRLLRIGTVAIVLVSILMYATLPAFGQREVIPDYVGFCEAHSRFVVWDDESQYAACRSFWYPFVWNMAADPYSVCTWKFGEVGHGKLVHVDSSWENDGFPWNDYSCVIR